MDLKKKKTLLRERRGVRGRSVRPWKNIAIGGPRLMFLREGAKERGPQIGCPMVFYYRGKTWDRIFPVPIGKKKKTHKRRNKKNLGVCFWGGGSQKLVYFEGVGS